MQPVRSTVLVPPVLHGVHDAAFPVTFLYVPIGHSTHASAIESFVAPAFAYFPAGHIVDVNIVHEDDPAREYVPLEQIPEQLEDVKFAISPHVPAVQLEHEFEPAYCPIGQPQIVLVLFEQFVTTLPKGLEHGEHGVQEELLELNQLPDEHV